MPWKKSKSNCEKTRPLFCSNIWRPQFEMLPKTPPNARFWMGYFASWRKRFRNRSIRITRRFLKQPERTSKTLNYFSTDVLMRLKTIIAPCVVCAFVLGCVYGKVSEIPRLQKCLSEMRIHDESCFSSDAKIVASGKSFPLSGL